MIRNRVVLLTLLAVGQALATASSAEELRRRGMIGVMLQPLQDDLKAQLKLEPTARGVLVTSVVPDSAAFEAGVKANDLVVKIGDQSIEGLAQLQTTMRKYYAGDAVAFTVIRDGAPQNLSVTLRPRAKENWADFDVVYDFAGPAGQMVRTIITKPKGEGKFPAVLMFLPIDTNTVERAQPSPDPLRKLIEGLTTAGYCTVRVERPGVGDSEGTDPHATTVDMDVKAFRHALESLKKKDFINPNAIFMFGHSSGSAIAVQVAPGSGAAGLITFAAMVRPWTEPALESMARRWELELMPTDETKKNVEKLRSFLKAVYVDKKSPKELGDADEDVKKLLTSQHIVDDDRFVFGLNYVYGQQLADLKLKDAWSKVDVPVLAIWGASDWVGSKTDTEMAVAAVNASRPGTATVNILPEVDHYLGKAADQEESFLAGRSPFNPVILTTLTQWMGEHKKGS